MESLVISTLGRVKNQDFLEQVSSLLDPADDILVVTLYFLNYFFTT